MSTFTTSRGTRAQHVSPRFDCPYRPSPARREAIHGRIIGIPDRRDWSAPIFIALALVIAAFFALQLARPLLKAASSASPLAEGSTLHLNDARMEKGQDQ